MYNTIEPLDPSTKLDSPMSVYDNLTSGSSSDSQGHPHGHLQGHLQGRPVRGRCCSAADKTYDSTRSSLSSGTTSSNNNKARCPHQVGKSSTILDQMWRAGQQRGPGANDSGVSEGGGPPSTSSQQASPWAGRACRLDDSGGCGADCRLQYGRESPIYAEPYQDETPDADGHIHPKRYYYGNNLNCGDGRPTVPRRRDAKDTVVHANYVPSTDNVWRTYGTLGQATPATKPPSTGSMREKRSKNSHAVYI